MRERLGEKRVEEEKEGKRRVGWDAESGRRWGKGWIQWGRVVSPTRYMAEYRGGI